MSKDTTNKRRLQRQEQDKDNKPNYKFQIAKLNFKALKFSISSLSALI